MSEKDANRAIVIGQALEKQITQKEAATRLNISTRQVRRLIKRIKQQGPLSVVHKGRGKPSKRKFTQDMIKQVLELIKEKYYDFGPTFAVEKLAAIDGVKISREWLRQILLEYGLRKARHRRQVIHQPRTRRPQYGDLIQVDGSHHAWFEARGPKCVALVFVDDATSKLQAVHFCESENLIGYFTSMKAYVENYGCPQEIYTDKHSVFTVNHMRGGEQKGKTQFARMLKELNIKQHLANSPQAKGRVERMNGVLQDRLVKELRMANISTIDNANAFMPEFIMNYNKKFAKPAQSEINSHSALPVYCDAKAIENIFSIQEPRKVSKALTVQYKNAVYVINQIRAVRTLRKRGVMVHERINGDIKMFFGEQELAIEFFEYADNYHQPMSRKELDIQLDHNKYKETTPANDMHNTNRIIRF